MTPTNRSTRPTTTTTWTLFALIAIVAAAPPSGSASETHTHAYIAAGAPQIFPGTLICDPMHDDDHAFPINDPPAQGTSEDESCVGGYSTAPQGGPYTQYVASLEDDNFDSAFLSVCVIPEGAHDHDDASEPHLFCGDEEGEAFIFTGCGSVLVPTGGQLEPLDHDTEIQALVATVHVDQDTLELCLGSTGTATSVFS